MQILNLILNFKGHVYVPKLICVRFNDIPLLFFDFFIFMISYYVLFIIDCIIFFVCLYLSLCENLY